MSFTQNRYTALLGEEPTEIDNLGNSKPIEKKNDQPPTRRDLRKTGQRQPAVSPPSRRGHRSNNKNVTENDALNESSNENGSFKAPREKPGRWEGRGRQFDRHSGTGIYDNEKKINQGWGKAGSAEFQGAYDSLDPKDPDAAERRTPRMEEFDENTKTLDEYFSERNTSSKFRLDGGRQANEGSDDSQWKNTVVFKKEEDAYFIGGSKKK